MIGLWTAMDFLLCAIDVGLYHLYCFKILGVNDRYSKYQYLFFGAILAGATFAITSITVYSLLKTVFITLLLFIYALKFFESFLKQKILYILLFCTLLMISETISIGTNILIGNLISWEHILQSGMERFIVGCVAKIIFILMFTFIVHFKSDEEILLPFRQWLAIISSFSIILIFAISLINFGFATNADLLYSRFLVISILALLFIYFLMYYFFYSISGYSQKLSELKLLELHEKYIEKYVLQKEESDKIIRIMSHDLKHNLLYWKQLAEDQKYIDTLKGIQDYEQKLEQNSLINVNNDIANAIINQKILFARQNHIKFEVSGFFCEDIIISKIDLCSLLGNLIDNAIEATTIVSNPTERKISMEIKNDENFLFITIANSYKLKPLVKNNVFFTRKKNPMYHGIGMVSINNITNKYYGSFETATHNGIFKTIIMLQAYDKKI